MHTSEIVQRAIEYIEDNLDQPLTLEHIAEAAAMSVPNLYRLFYAMTGHPIKEYIRRRRTSEAACLLRQSDMPTIDVAFRCGFDTYQTFLKSFKRTTGMTPGQYRQVELIYSFERINLPEKVAYSEEREVSDRYPDVKVIRMASQKGLGYRHAADREEGIEDAALARFRELLSRNGIDAGQLRIFGWNVDRDGEPLPCGYRIVAVGNAPIGVLNDDDLHPADIGGGLYAVTRTPAGSGSSIVAAWNRLLSEWLPRSTFELGEHGFLEEYQQFGGKVSRLKLYLPVKRRVDSETIKIAERPRVRVLSFRSEGVGSMERADQAATDWVSQSGFAGNRRLRVYMSNAYGIPPGESFACEICIAPPDDYIPSAEDESRMAWLEGGSYACLTTGAYGSMTGVIERIYRWLDASSEYEPDGERTWYAEYRSDRKAKTGAEFERSVTVECCVPVGQSKNIGGYA